MRLLFATACAAALTVAGEAAACPNFNAPGAFGQISLRQGFQPDPYTQEVVAGGIYSLQSCGFEGVGWVAEAPDFELYYETTGAYVLTIAVQSSVDTILLVNDPDGNFYYNDDGGENGAALVRLDNPKAGLYDIWIGTYDGQNNAPALLVITELN